MMRSLFSGVAGLRTHQSRMDVPETVPSILTEEEIWL